MSEPSSFVADTRLTERLNTFLDWLEQSARSAESFTLEQAPLLAREYVAWQFWSSLISLLLCLLIIILGTIFATLLIRRGLDIVNGKKRGDEFACFFPAAFIILVCALLGGLGSYLNGATALKTHVAPRVIILDYVKSITAPRFR